MSRSALAEAFSRAFGRAPEAVARAPGRVNLIGEHTDYNDGLVLPMAIDLATCVAVAARDDDRIRVLSHTYPDMEQWRTGAWRECECPHWTSYVAGVAEGLLSRGARLGGFDLLICSDVPPGAGLSSSAALEVATALALAYLCGEPLESQELIDLCRSAERDYAGAPCGLMDQTVSLLARDGAALLLDCRTRETSHVPAQLPGWQWLIIDSGVRHELAAGEYAQRQRECVAASDYFRRRNPGVRALRDLTSDMVRAHASQMTPPTAARALHVVSENERVTDAVAALRGRDSIAFGALMGESHESLRVNYEVSCRELDRLVSVLRLAPGLVGARMTGAGFGGAVIALAREGTVETIRAALRAGYDAHFPIPATLRVVRPSAGAGLLFA